MSIARSATTAAPSGATPWLSAGLSIGFVVAANLGIFVLAAVLLIKPATARTTDASPPVVVPHLTVAPVLWVMPQPVRAAPPTVIAHRACKKTGDKAVTDATIAKTRDARRAAAAAL